MVDPANFVIFVMMPQIILKENIHEKQKNTD